MEACCGHIQMDEICWLSLDVLICYTVLGDRVIEAKRLMEMLPKCSATLEKSNNCTGPKQWKTEK